MKYYNISIWILIFSLVGILAYTVYDHHSQMEYFQTELEQAEANAERLMSDLWLINNQYHSLLNNMNNLGNVDVTVYQPVEEQTNSRYWETADQSIIDLENPKSHRWIAVSRDLHERWGGPLEFGSLVWVSGIGEHSGLYEVRDIMNRRFTKRIDILIGLEDDIFSFTNNPNINLYEIPSESKKFIVSTEFNSNSFNSAR